MADLREFIVLRSNAVVYKPDSPRTQMLGNFRMRVRRVVVRTARLAVFRQLYKFVYDAHIWVARQIARRYAGTSALYLTAGAGKGDLRLGISDVDLVFVGTWTKDRQFRLMKIIGILAKVLPMIDAETVGSILTIADMAKLSQTNFILGNQYHKGKQEWRLLFGQNILATLPDLSERRYDAGIHFDAARWWGTFARTSFGQGLVARDHIFQNSICFKTVAEILRDERMLDGQEPPLRRSDVIREELNHQPSPILQSLLLSADQDFLSIPADPRESTLNWLLPRFEHFDAKCIARSAFARAAAVVLDGAASERVISPSAAAHTNRILEVARRIPNLRAACLCPSSTFFSPDALSLVLEFERGIDPTVAELRALCHEHLRLAGDLPQRIFLHVLRGPCAYLLDTTNPLEIWSYRMSPQTNPDFFAALSDPQMLLYGSPHQPQRDIRWSYVSHELMAEEINVRRAAHGRFGFNSRATSMANMRNLWRFLQLLVIERSFRRGTVLLPTTIAAINRALVAQDPAGATDLRAVEAAHRDALLAHHPANPAANPADLGQVIDRIAARFA